MLLTHKTSKLADKWHLTQEEIGFFNLLKQRREKEIRPMVLWGWKRDEVIDGTRQPESRTVYFSADLELNGSQVEISRAYFFLETRAKVREIEILAENLKAVKDADCTITISSDPEYDDYSKLRLVVGSPTVYDTLSVKRRLKGKPRLTIPKPRLVPVETNYNLSKYAPFALCVGSGLSAESGLPLLGSIHNMFEVDNMETGSLVFGAQDKLPQRIALSPYSEFIKFCEFTMDAIKAKPSQSHFQIADLYKRGVIRQVFTDNMDDILGKVDIQYTETRLSIFPDRYPVEFDKNVKALLVVGVAVDRRDVIKQARHKGLKIIAINPVFGVAPHSRNMDYLCKGDIFYRETAKEALSKIIKDSGF
jgi:hypothetical protein